jgi:hypothetical protein
MHWGVMFQQGALFSALPVFDNVAFLLLLGCGAVFVAWWMQSGTPQTKTYRILSDSSVAGLSVDARVKYKGVDVGSVREIKLDPGDPRRILIRITLVAEAPVTHATYAEIAKAGLTGASYLALRDEEGGAAPLRRAADQRGEGHRQAAERAAGLRKSSSCVGHARAPGQGVQALYSHGGGSNARNPATARAHDSSKPSPGGEPDALETGRAGCGVPAGLEPGDQERHRPSPAPYPAPTGPAAAGPGRPLSAPGTTQRRPSSFSFTCSTDARNSPRPSRAQGRWPPA